MKSTARPKSARRSFARALSLTPMEIEAITLKASLDLIGNMVNHDMMTFSPDKSNCEIRFPDHTHQAYFSILLSDFLSTPQEFFGESEDYLSRLVSIGAQPLLRSDQIALLKTASERFQGWLQETANAPMRWFPTLNLEIDLKITRRDLVTMSGNQTKHNFTQQTRQATKLRRILSDNGKDLRFDECLIALSDFYAQMYNDIFVYHSSTMAAALNDIRWGIYEYTRRERQECTTSWPFDSSGQLMYEYHYPDDVKSSLGKHFYRELMDDVRDCPAIPRFVVSELLQKRY